MEMSELNVPRSTFNVERLIVNTFSFPKSRRLTRGSEFEQVRKQGKTQGNKLLILNVLEIEAATSFRAGFVTSRKIGGAVARNRVRRRLREIVRKHQHRMIKPVWIVTVAREASADASFAVLEDAWLRLAKRASILAL